MTTATDTVAVSDLTVVESDDHGASSSPFSIGVVQNGDFVTYTIVVINVSSNTVDFAVTDEFDVFFGENVRDSSTHWHGRQEHSDNERE